MPGGYPPAAAAMRKRGRAVPFCGPPKPASPRRPPPPPPPNSAATKLRRHSARPDPTTTSGGGAAPRPHHRNGGSAVALIGACWCRGPRWVRKPCPELFQRPPCSRDSHEARRPSRRAKICRVHPLILAASRRGPPRDGRLRCPAVA